MKKSLIVTFCVALVVTLVLIYVIPGNNKQTAAEPAAVSVSEEVTDVPEDIKSKYTPLQSGGQEETLSFETAVFDIEFTTRGAGITALRLKNHYDANGKPVDFVFRGPHDNPAYLMYWGDDLGDAVLDIFSYKVYGDRVVFTNDYKADNGKTFTVTKTFEFRNSDYLMKVSVDISGEGVMDGEYAYTLAYEPQVGPAFESLSNNRYEYRSFYLGLLNDKGKVKRSTIRLTDGFFFTTRQSKWISLTGKYFMLIAAPEDGSVAYKYSARTGAGELSQNNSVFISVPSESADGSKSFYFYCGPQLKSYLGSYYNGSDNEWGIKNLNLDDAMESGSLLGWLENLLKLGLKMFYSIIPNYGVAIILLTILIKILTWPIQSKSMTSSQKMTALSPMMEEIKKKYPNNQQKQNAEIQKLYQEYGISPMSGCTPILLQFLQFPILFAFYGLLNRHFELRGAMFIPGWINDLSIPETVATLPFRLPLLGNQIHILPFLYVATTVLTMLYTQKSNGMDGSKQAGGWFLTWGMPVMFLFILYSAPSGLFVYWVTQGLLGALQQYVMNIKKKKQGPVTLTKVKGRK